MFALLLVLAAADTDGPWILLGQSGFSGEIVVNNSTGSSLFYWQINALNSNILKDSKPLILWLDGGPGCSGELALLGEGISPFFIPPNLVPVFNNNSWTQNFHILSIDFPYNVGYSFAASQTDLKNDTVSSVTYLYSFLQRLLQKYPQWFNRDIYVFGESYGGHYVPALAYKILNENQSVNITGNGFINIKGIGMQDPLGDTMYQSQYYDSFGFNLGLLDLGQKETIRHLQSSIFLSILNGDYVQANDYQQEIFSMLSNFTAGVSIYDIREFSDPDMGNYSEWLNLNSTKTLLHVPLGLNWQECNHEIYSAFSADIPAGFATLMMPFILSKVKVLIWNGQDDYIINTPGIENWLSGIKWDNMYKFLKSRKATWFVQGQLSGYVQSYSNLTFVQLLKAGHLGAFYQPVSIKDMINRFILNQGWN